jgi:pimeloyl-ACP methyl ester carboxylesterase
MIALADERRYRVYALDFWGFGDSANGNPNGTTIGSGEPFQISSYVEMVHQFMDTLGILSAPVAGHSMGGTVALQLALSYPERIKKVAIVGSPIIGSSLNPFLKLAGYGWIAELVWRYPIMLTAIMRILLAGDSKRVRQMIFRDVKRTSIESFFRSIGDLRATDLRSDLNRLELPTLGIFGRNDNIVSPSNAQILTAGIPKAEIMMMEKSRHFPLIDEPAKFVSTLTQFLRTSGSNGS